MNRGFGGRAIRALLAVAVLCSFTPTSPAQAATSCPARKTKIVWVSSDAWRSHEIISTSTGGKLPIADCATSLANPNVEAGTYLVTDFNRLNCNGTGGDIAGVIELDVPEGTCATYATEAVYRDAAANLNIVSIPEISDSIAPHARARFDAIVNDGERATFLAIFPRDSGSTRIRIKAFSGNGKAAGDETISVSGFTFYELQANVRIGSAIVENLGSQVGPETGVPVDVVAFAGYRAGGSPRVILPQLLAAQ